METLEIWKDIPWYEGLYQVSNLWRVKSLLNRHGRWPGIMSSQTIDRGNWYNATRTRLTDISWIRKTFWVHRLVASAFLWFNLKTPMKEAVIMHINNDATDNRLENLKIWTQSENTRQCIDEWRWKQFEMKWSKHNMAKLDEEKVLNIRELSLKWMRNIDISRLYWVWRTTRCDILQWRTWTHI